MKTSTYDKALSTFRDLGGHRIAHFCNPTSVEKIEDVNSYEPVINAFCIESEVLEVVPLMQK